EADRVVPLDLDGRAVARGVDRLLRRRGGVRVLRLHGLERALDAGDGGAGLHSVGEHAEKAPGVRGRRLTRRRKLSERCGERADLRGLAGELFFERSKCGTEHLAIMCAETEDDDDEKRDGAEQDQDRGKAHRYTPWTTEIRPKQTAFV